MHTAVNLISELFWPVHKNQHLKQKENFTHPWLQIPGYTAGDVQDFHVVSVSEMTYIVLGGVLNSTHSLTNLRSVQQVPNYAT